MKKVVIAIFCFFFSLCSVMADNIFSHKTTAQKAAKESPAFESTTCKFVQERQMKSSNVVLKSGGNFKFIKDKGVIFETTYPIQSTASYTAGQNKTINKVIKAITNKDYSFLEKNFDIYQTKTQNSWILALTPKAQGQLQGEMKNIIIWGTTKNGKGYINKIIIESTSTKTTQTFLECK